MSLLKNIQEECEGKALDRTLDKEREVIDAKIKGFTSVADNRGLREYFEKLSEEAKEYIKSTRYWWQVEAALRLRV